MSPLIARPFLRSRCVLVVNYTTIIDEWPYANSTTGIDNSTHIFHTQEEMHRDTHVRWAYWIVALLHVSTIQSHEAVSSRSSEISSGFRQISLRIRKISDSYPPTSGIISSATSVKVPRNEKRDTTNINPLILR